MYNAYFNPQALRWALLLVLNGLVPAVFGQTFAPVVTYPIGASSRGVAVADINSDGKADIIGTNYNGSVGVLLSSGNGAFQPVVTYSTGSGSGAYSVAIADVNADGKLDIITANAGSNTAGVLLGTSTGTFAPVVTYATGNYPRTVVVTDVSGDNKPDIVVTTSAGSGVLLGSGNGTFQPVITYTLPFSMSGYGLAVADVNNDNKPDIVLPLESTNGSGSVGVLLGSGGGSFGAIAYYSAGLYSAPISVAVADMNGDNKPDIVVAYTLSGAAAVTGQLAGVLLGNGNGTFQPVAAYAMASQGTPFGVAVADFNGDNKQDIVATSQNADAAGVLLNNGNGTFGPVLTLATGSGSLPYGVATGDLNGDGKQDIVTANYGNSGTVSVFYNTSPLLSAAPNASAPTLILYPNPAQDNVQLKITGLMPDARILEVNIVNATGQRVAQHLLPVTQGACDASLRTVGIEPGLYLLQLGALDMQGTASRLLPAQRLGIQ